MAKKPEPKPTNPVSLFWLTYRHPDGRAAGVVVMESSGLLHARLKAGLAGADRELEFVSGHKLDKESAGQIPENMMGRLLDWADDATVPSFGPRMRCSRCGKLGATAIPNWIERADTLSGSPRR